MSDQKVEELPDSNHPLRINASQGNPCAWTKTAYTDTIVIALQQFHMDVSTKLYEGRESVNDMIQLSHNVLSGLTRGCLARRLNHLAWERAW